MMDIGAPPGREKTLPPPSKYNNLRFMRLTQGVAGVDNFVWELELSSTVRLIPEIRIKNPTLDWIKINLAKVETMCFDVCKKPLDIWCKGTEVYTKFQKMLHEDCDLKRVNIFARESPFGDIVDLFPASTRIEIHVCLQNLRRENVVALLPKVSTLTCLLAPTKEEAEFVLSHNKLDTVNISDLDFFPLNRYVEEWSRGEREIDSWTILNVTGTDLPKCKALFTRRDGKMLLSDTIVEDGKLNVQFQLIG